MTKTQETSNNSSDALSPDEVLLRAQGHQGELPRQFSSFAALSLAFAITNSWVGYCATFVTPLLAGGGPTVFWGIIVAAVACLIITAGLAELASAYPSSGGQYHFAFMVSSVETRAAAAFVTGWVSTLAWCLTATSAAIFCAQIILALASFSHPDYVSTQWQTYLVYLLLLVAGALFVCYAPRLLPAVEKFSFWSSLLGFLVTLITMLAASESKQTARVVFVTYTNQTGWSDGTAFFIGIGACMYAFLATDAVTHIAEDLDAIAGSELPILELFYQATGYRQNATIFFTFWILLNFFGAFVSCITTAGRLAWAFSRDNGLPYSKTFAKVHSIFETPINATALCSIFCGFYGLIYIGSTTAFNSIIAVAILALNVSYAFPQGIVLFRGRDKVLPMRSFRLGGFGIFVNAFSCLWCAFYAVIFCFPTILPAEVGSMNYLSVVVVGIALLIVLFWYGEKRKTFTGPNINLEGLEITQEQIHRELEKESEAKGVV
ncbi:choline transporter [Lipomyces kononenkoae]|uniref:Choline transporter n=1 Tax=Lipomyces kononenkoae TaxID=34357 RepID=A0ACC3T3H6_LIPKO